MKSILFSLLTFCTLLTDAQQSDEPSNQMNMKLNAGIITEKLEESKTFYMEKLGFGLSFENDFYVLLHTPDGSAQFSFLKADHPSQHAVFKRPYSGEGMYLTIEVEDVDALHRQLKEKGVKMTIELRDEPWGDRHFAVIDPNGLGIDFVTYSAPEE